MLGVVPGSGAVAKAGEGAPRAQRGWLGIVMDEEPGGRVVIRDVLDGSPAQQGKLRAGDVLKRVNGTPVRSAHETAREVGKSGAGVVVRVTIDRGGKEREVPVRLAPFPTGEELLRAQHVGKPAPALRGLRSLMGTRGPELSDYRGKVLVLDFWASWCIACRVTSMHMNRWHERYAAQGLHVLGVASEPSEAAARGARRFDIRYDACADPDTETASAYHVRELPSVIVVDRQGIVRDVATGYDRARMQRMEALVQRLLSEPAPTVR